MPLSKPFPLVRQSSSSSSSSTSRSTTETRRRNSFASATASSLAHGGPATMAPKMIHHRSRRKRIPSAKDDTTDKENCDNETPRKNKTVEETPKKSKGSARGTPGKTASSSGNPILSPIPYWKVLAERDGETSPRLTRSASKKRMSENMRELDDLDVSREENGVAGILKSGLRFESPSAFCATSHGKINNDSIGGWNDQREREMRFRQERILGLDDARFEAGRAKKKPKTVDARDSQGPTMNPEELRKVVTECLANDNDSKLHAALQDKAELKSKYADLESRYARLQNEFEERIADAESKGRQEMERQLEEERNKWNEARERLEAKCLEQRERIVGYVEEISTLETKCQKRNESGKWEAKWKEKQAQLQEVERELTRVQEERIEMETRWEEQSKELQAVKDQLVQSNRRKDELEQVHATDDGAVVELQRQLAVLREEHTHMIEKLEAANDAVQHKSELLLTLESTVQQLERENLSVNEQINESALRTKELEQHVAVAREDLQSAREELNIANSKLERVQSPRSRSAVEEQHQKEVSLLSNRISTLENRLNVKEDELQDLIQENTAIKEELDQLKAENEELATELEEREKQLADSGLKAKQNEAEFKVQLGDLKTELQKANEEKAESSQILDELAQENERLLAKIECTQHELQVSREEMAISLERVEQLENEFFAQRKSREQVEQQLVCVQHQVFDLQAQLSSLQQELSASQQLVATIQQHKLDLEKTNTQLSNELSTAKMHLHHAKSEISSLESQLQAKQHYCNNFENIERELLRENHVLNEIRRKLHNRVIQLSGNIRVFVRVRPMIESEMLLLTDGNSGNSGTVSRPSSSSGIGTRPSSRGSMTSRLSYTKPASKPSEALTHVSPFHFPSITADRSSNGKTSSSLTSYSDLTKQTIEITEPYRDRGGLNPRQKKWKYGFDRVYSPANTQNDIWEGASPLVQSCIDGFHVCMFAYGQTGSGKTFTMIGDAQNPGLIPRAVQMFFETKDDIEKKCRGQGQDVNIGIGVELLEIYNEEVRDLLSPDAGTNGKLVKVDLNGHEAVGNVVASAASQKDVEDVLKLAQSRRCVKATKSNAESSRSHLLFTIHFQVASSTNEELNRNGCLHIIDLAGSERVDKSGSQGALLTEAKHINKSLSALTGVIEKLQAKSEHIPYRDSKLTYLLRNSLGGDSKTLAIVCCSPQQEHFQESHNSIRFAAKASKVELKEGNKVDV
ncbi:hypothetical protein ACHAW6_015209 [Cyclotella cf. meneghiniana]